MKEQWNPALTLEKLTRVRPSETEGRTLNRKRLAWGKKINCESKNSLFDFAQSEFFDFCYLFLVTVSCYHQLIILLITVPLLVSALA